MNWNSATCFSTLCPAFQLRHRNSATGEAVGSPGHHSRPFRGRAFAKSDSDTSVQETAASSNRPAHPAATDQPPTHRSASLEPHTNRPSTGSPQTFPSAVLIQSPSPEASTFQELVAPKGGSVDH